MKTPNIALQRLHSQLLAGNALSSPQTVVSHFGAIQAQDYLGALWAIGKRMRTAVEADVERAVAERRIVRCWPMRGTLHFVAAEDIHWMLGLLAPRVLKRHMARLEREFDLDAKTLGRCRTLAESALRGSNAMTRAELYAVFDRGRVATQNGRGLQILFALAHDRVLCFGSRRGKQPTFVLLDEWVAPSKPKPREEALAEIARRYYRSHGPATVADFVWWSGLTVKEANEAIALAGPFEYAAAAKSAVHLLPPFDEYTVAYKDRSAILDSQFARNLNAGGGMLNAVVVINGRVAAIWTRTLRSSTVAVKLAPLRELTPREQSAIDREAARYATFLGIGLRQP